VPQDVGLELFRQEGLELLGELPGLRHLGPVPPPRVFFRERLPRTRSGKILRRLLKAELLGLDPGDTSGLEEDYGAGKAP